MRRWGVGALSLVVWACGPGDAVTRHPGGSNDAVSSRLLGSPTGADGADRACNVVLRSVGPNQNRGGYETYCVPNTTDCWIVLRGVVDISNEAEGEGAEAWVLYQSGSDPTWYQAQGTAVDGANFGYARYTFALEQHTTPQNGPARALQLIPFLRTANASRVFDHNRVPGAFDNYALSPDANWTVPEDATACASPTRNGDATVSFRTGWTQDVQGALVAGGKLNVWYDLARMPQCFQSLYNGLPAWATLASVRFEPSGDVVSRNVRGAQDPSTGHWSSELFILDIPPSATGVQAWFYTSGDLCEPSWDSDYGQNYSFAVQAAP